MLYSGVAEAVLQMVRTETKMMSTSFTESENFDFFINLVWRVRFLILHCVNNKCSVIFDCDVWLKSFSVISFLISREIPGFNVNLVLFFSFYKLIFIS